MRRYLGVDGGGTKTAFVLLDEGGDVLAESTGESSYYFATGIDLVPRVLSAGIAEVCRLAGIGPADVTRAFFGLSTYGEVAKDLPVLDAAPAAILGHDRYSCANDMVAGWAGSLAGGDGINVVAGTGSMTYGENAGRGVRVGGWGELFGDEGSGHWIAVRGLEAFGRMSDGRLPDGPLRETIRQALGIEDDLDVIDIVLNQWNGARGRVAALSRPVVAAATAGDEVAVAILAEACAHLADLVSTTRRRLEFDAQDRVPVSYSGGMFTVEAIRIGFEQALARHGGEYDVCRPEFGPAIGAALYAARADGHPLDAAALGRLQAR